MPEGNAERARQLHERFNDRDLEGVLALCDPEVEYFSRIVELQGGGPFRGHEGLREWWREILGVFPDFHVEIEDVREMGAFTVSRLYQRTQGHESEAPADQTQWFVHEWRAGKVILGRVFLDESDALKAAGSDSPA
jgi:ketosteroid isomerase-like protein